MKDLGSVIATVGIFVMLATSFLITGRSPRVNNLPQKWRWVVWVCVPVGLGLTILGIVLASK